MLTADQQTFLDSAAAASVASEKATGLPAELTLAQAIFESGWGKACPGNNCFGIKVDQRGSGVQYVMTQEFINGSWVKEPLAFEKYDSLADCFTDHARLITEEAPYADAWAQFQKDHLVHAFIIAVGRIYATAPNYGLQISGMCLSPWFDNALYFARRGDSNASATEEATLP